MFYYMNHRFTERRFLEVHRKEAIRVRHIEWETGWFPEEKQRHLGKNV